MTYPVTRNVQQVMGHIHQVQALNLGLVFDRLLPQKEAGPYNKNTLIALLAYFQQADKEIQNAFIQRWRAMVAAQHGQVLRMQSQWRFLTGVGINTPLEVGFTFHRYGFPYLPGSGVKGITRQRYLIQLSSELGVTELDQLDQILYSKEGDDLLNDFQAVFKRDLSTKEFTKCRNFQVLFGNMERAGKVIFFDAIPASNVELEIDVMTPHFGDYYMGNAAPHDGLRTNPINFLTVAPNTVFYFGIGWRGEMNEAEGRALSKIRTMLKAALGELGAGAKTNAGYGYFYEFVED